MMQRLQLLTKIYFALAEVSKLEILGEFDKATALRKEIDKMYTELWRGF